MISSLLIGDDEQDVGLGHEWQPLLRSQPVEHIVVFAAAIGRPSTWLVWCHANL